MREHAEMIANLNSNVPLIADADTGYGGTNSCYSIALFVVAWLRRDKKY
jgi:hypothetical protein